MTSLTNLREKIEQTLYSGIFSELLEEEKQRITGWVSYFLAKDAVANLEATIENAQLITSNLDTAVKDAYLLGNMGCASCGFAVGGVSVLKFCQTKNTIAKIFYGTGTVCGSTAAIAGTLKAYSGTCGLSLLAVGGDMFGGACLYVGNKAQKMGDMVDGKKRLSWRPRSFAQRPKYNSGMGYRGLSFITTPGSGDISFASIREVIPHMPYETILIIGGTVLTVYSYVKISKTIYHYLKLKFSQKMDPSKVIHKSALFLIDSINNVPDIKKVNRVYSAVLKLEYFSF